jgi:NAD(P)-dependent dehydrogenase (short-subunit alcohol dehydrogenase family)
MLISGAKVVMLCLDLAKAVATAAKYIRNCNPSANIFLKQINLASLQSIRNCAKEVLIENENVHILINNAGVAGVPQSRIEDGFESYFGINH